MTQPHSMDDLTRQAGLHLSEVQDRLHDRYQQVPPDEIREYTNAEADRLAGSPIQAFVPILVERAVRERLENSDRPRK
jgi:hypothetical protein